MILREWPFELLFNSTVKTIWDYWKEDRSICHALVRLLIQLRTDAPQVQRMLRLVETADLQHKVTDHVDR